MSTSARALSARWEALREQREAAVDAAIMAIVAEDPSRLTVAEVSQRAGISRQTFYKRFTTLQEAVATAQGRVIETVAERIGDSLASNPAPVNGLETVLRIFEVLFEIYAADPVMLRFTSFYDFSFRVHQMTDADREQHPLAPPSDADGGIYEMVRAGQRDGSIDPTLHVEATSRALSTSLLGVIQRLQIQDDWTNGRDRAARETYAVMLAAWKKTLAST